MREKPVEFEHYSAPPPPPTTGANPDSRQRDTPPMVNHRPTSISPGHTESEDQTEPPLGPRSNPSALEQPPLPRCPETDSHNPSSLSEVFTSYFPIGNTDPAFVTAYTAKEESQQGKGLVDKGQEAVQHLSTPSPVPESSFLGTSQRTSGLTNMEGQRSPSPQFSPQRLSDKPPLFLEEESNR